MAQNTDPDLLDDAELLNLLSASPVLPVRLQALSPYWTDATKARYHERLAEADVRIAQVASFGTGRRVAPVLPRATRLRIQI